MALKKQVTTRQGYQAEYWKVTRIEIDKNSRDASCVLSLYKDKSMSHIKDGNIGEQSRMVALRHYTEDKAVNYALHPEFDIDQAMCLDENLQKDLEVIEPLVEDETENAIVEPTEETTEEKKDEEIVGETDDTVETGKKEEITEPTTEEEKEEEKEEIVEPTIDEWYTKPGLEEPVISENLVTPDTDADDNKDNYTDRFERYFGENSIYSDVYEACYAMAKELEVFFQDATDC